MLQEIGRTLGIACHPLEGNVVAEGGALPRFDKLALELGDHADIAVDDLVFHVAAAFRGHPHINNVLTHISGANWNAIEAALRAILDPSTGSRDLSPLARNIIDLMCADRGITGRIVKPFYRDLLKHLLGNDMSSRFITHITSLFLESEIAARSGVVLNPVAGSGFTNKVGGG
jgi:hypothetical protein